MHLCIALCTDHASKAVAHSVLYIAARRAEKSVLNPFDLHPTTPTLTPSLSHMTRFTFLQGRSSASMTSLWRRSCAAVGPVPTRMRVRRAGGSGASLSVPRRGVAGVGHFPL